MQKPTQLNLIKVAHSIEVRVSDSTENIFESTVQHVFSDDAQKKELFVDRCSLPFIKESTCLSSKINHRLCPSGQIQRRIRKHHQEGESSKWILRVKDDLLCLPRCLPPPPPPPQRPLKTRLPRLRRAMGANE